MVRYIAALGIAVGWLLAAPNKEHLAIQRDIAQLQEQVKALESTLTERMIQLDTLLKQSLDQSTRTNATLAVIENNFRDRLDRQATNLAGPVAALGSKLDQMAAEFQTLRESVSDLTAQMAKLQAQLVDITNTLKVMQAPPSPPGPAPSSGPPQGVSAQQLYDNARRDQMSGNFDLALQGYQEFLKWYGNTELAPNAQYHIGEIYYFKGDLDNALKAFDAVLERYPENNKTPDAMYMKGMTLLKSGQRTEAGREFLNVIQKYPRSEVAQKAREQRKALGLSVPGVTPSRGRRR